MNAFLEVPYLRSGVGETPAHGGCVMQIVDWVSSGGWSDKPECVHPFLLGYAISANDTARDSQRQKLIGLIPRLMNTAQYGPPTYGLFLALRRVWHRDTAWSKYVGTEWDRWHYFATGPDPIYQLTCVLDVFEEWFNIDRSKREMPDLSGVCEILPPARKRKVPVPA